MTPMQRFSVEDARRVGETLGIDWQQVAVEQFRRGMEVELEHGARDPETNVTNDDLSLTGKIAWAHLKSSPTTTRGSTLWSKRQMPTGRPGAKRSERGGLLDNSAPSSTRQPGSGPPKCGG